MWKWMYSILLFIRHQSFMIVKNIIVVYRSWMNWKSIAVVTTKVAVDSRRIRDVIVDKLDILVENYSLVIISLIAIFIINWQFAIVTVIFTPLVGVVESINFVYIYNLTLKIDKILQSVWCVSCEKKVFRKQLHWQIISLTSTLSTASIWIRSYINNSQRSSKRQTELVTIEQSEMDWVVLFLLYLLEWGYNVYRLRVTSTSPLSLFWVLYSWCMESSLQIRSSSLPCVAITGIKVEMNDDDASSALFTGIGMAYIPNSLLAKKATIDMFNLIDEPSALDTREMIGDNSSDIQGSIEFCNVSFKYPSRPDSQILKNLNLKIPAGSSVAFVGESGCGKSTIISLIERMYNPGISLCWRVDGK